MNTQKFKEGVLQGLGIVFVLGISGIAYASFTWVIQTDVNTGDTLTATAWNDMINNQNYLKQEVETKISQNTEIDMGTNKITNLGAPVASTDAATKAYTDSVSASGEGKYQISCSNYGTSTSGFCVRIDTITGVTEVKHIGILNDTGGFWLNHSVTPW